MVIVVPHSEPAVGAAGHAGADQVAYWNGDAGMRWAAQQPRIDAAFAQLTQTVLDHAAPRPGDVVVDIGCGCGATVLGLAARVGPGGSVTGIDLSRPMLDVAAERVRSRQLTNVRLVLADASTHPFGEQTSDLAFSRFGVMFFVDPVKAFANIRRALRPEGRLAFVCWRSFAENPCFRVPFEAAAPFLPPQPPSDPEAPGPFALADADRVRRILATAGFSNIDIVRHEGTTSLADPGELEAAAEFAGRIGPVGRALGEAAPETRAAAQAAIRHALEAYQQPEGIVLTASVWLVSARN